MSNLTYLILKLLLSLLFSLLAKFNECLDRAEFYAKAEKASQFGIGDAIIKANEFTSGEYNDRAVYDDFEAVTGLSRGTLKQYCHVATSYKRLIRINDLSFKHHQIALDADQADRQSFLKEAQVNNWSCSELKKQIKGHNDLEVQNEVGYILCRTIIKSLNSLLVAF
jgi:hypothetical protein